MIPGIGNYLAQGCIPGGTQRNWTSYGHKIGPIPEEQRYMLADPQTSGGLLIAAGPEAVEEVAALLRGAGLPESQCQPFGVLEALEPTPTSDQTVTVPSSRKLIQVI
jgi:selenide,water dikinase